MEPDEIMTIPDHASPICPLPGLGHCVRERCNFWDEVAQECTGACFEPYEPAESGSPTDPVGPCLISFYEDYD